jgi:hypothetical protein
MLNKCDFVQTALEAILLPIYGWDSCPVLDTNISGSLLAIGCNFSFLIDFSADTHAVLISAPGAIASYSCTLVEGLEACCAMPNNLFRSSDAGIANFLLLASGPSHVLRW